VAGKQNTCANGKKWHDKVDDGGIGSIEVAMIDTIANERWVT
jgi:hypothetical protein